MSPRESALPLLTSIHMMHIVTVPYALSYFSKSCIRLWPIDGNLNVTLKTSRVVSRPVKPTMRQTLVQVWEKVAKPVIDALGLEVSRVHTIVAPKSERLVIRNGQEGKGHACIGDSPETSTSSQCTQEAFMKALAKNAAPITWYPPTRLRRWPCNGR